jgi:hypothetical protein
VSTPASQRCELSFADFSNLLRGEVAGEGEARRALATASPAPVSYFMGE